MSEQQGSEIDDRQCRWREFFRLLVSQKKLIAAFCLPAVLASLLLTYLASEKYEAATIIYYRPVQTTILTQKGAEAFGSPVPVTTFKVISQTLFDIAGSDVVLGPVVDALGLDQKPDRQHLAWHRRLFGAARNLAYETAGKVWSFLKHGRVIEADPRQKAINELRKSIKIGAKKESYLFVLLVKYKDPVKVAAIVDAIGAELVAWLKRQDQQVNREKLEQLRTRIVDSEGDLQEMRTQRSAIFHDAGMVAISEEAAKGVSNLYEMELEQARHGALAAEKRKVIAELGEVLDTRSQVKASVDDYRAMKSKRLFETVELKALQAKVTTLDSALAELRRKLEKMPQVQMKIDELDTRISAKKLEFQQLSELYLESSERFANDRGEVRTLHPAIVSAGPVQPIKIYHVALTAILSLLTAIASIAVMDYFNIRVFLNARGEEPPTVPATANPGDVSNG